MLGEMRVYWLKNQTTINQEIINPKNQVEDSLQNKNRNCSTLTISHLTREDSGIYFCEMTVEIPFLQHVRGNGTIITVLDRESTADSK